MKSMMESLGVDRLNMPDRLALLEEIWDSLAAQSEQLEMPQWHQDELDRRLRSDAAVSSWPEVRARLERPS